MSAAQPETYLTLLRHATLRLKEAQIEEPAQNARRLLCATMGVAPTALIARELDAASHDHAQRFEEVLRRRLGREPLAHILGETSFYDLELDCDGRALIPRADSECVIDLALRYVPRRACSDILDLGTGSGCLLLALLSQRPGTKGIGVDISAAAIALARQNADRTGLSDRVEFYHNSWYDFSDWHTADLVISNPPYIQQDIIPTLTPEVRDHDPRLALDGGHDGLTAYRELIALARHRMKEHAVLVLEIGYDQDQSVSGLLTGSGFEIIGRRQDLSGQDRALAACQA